VYCVLVLGIRHDVIGGGRFARGLARGLARVLPRPVGVAVVFRGGRPLARLRLVSLSGAFLERPKRYVLRVETTRQLVEMK
jgi:hypothetical protein